MFEKQILKADCSFNDLRVEHKVSERPTLSPVVVMEVWKMGCKACDIPYLSPRMGRAFFACNWNYLNHKSMFGLTTILRHEDINATEKYLAKLIDYPFVKNEFNQGLKSPFAGSCIRFDSCLLSAPDCYCKMFTAKETVITTPQK